MSAFSMMSSTPGSTQLTGNKRQLDADYLELSKSLPPVNLHATPLKKSLKKVYGPIKPVEPRDTYLDNLANSELVSRREKVKRHTRYLLNKHNSASPPTRASPPTKRIRFGNKQTVRIPKKRPEYKNALKILKHENRILKKSIFPNLADEQDDDRRLTDLLKTDVPSDIEEETDATIYSPTIEENPIPKSYTLHIYLKDNANNLIRMLPLEQSISDTMLIEDLMVLIDDIAEANGYNNVNIFIGKINEKKTLNPFLIHFNSLSKPISMFDNLITNHIIDAVIQLS